MSFGLCTRSCHRNITTTGWFERAIPPCTLKSGTCTHGSVISKSFLPSIHACIRPNALVPPLTLTLCMHAGENGHARYGTHAWVGYFVLSMTSSNTAHSPHTRTVSSALRTRGSTHLSTQEYTAVSALCKTQQPVKERGTARR